MSGSEDGPVYEIPNDPTVSPADIQPGADLSEADLSEADLREADLPEATLFDADLPEATLFDADLPEADLGGATLSEADLRGANLSEANLYKTDLSEADLRFADLSEAVLRRATLSEATLRGADLSEAVLAEADLSGADLGYADLSEATLREADLPKANLTATTLNRVDLVNATLTDTLLRDVSLSEARFSRKTEVTPPGERIKELARDTQDDDDGVFSDQQDVYDAIARANHQLRTAYSQNGLLSQARTARVRERKARRAEARKAGGLGGWITYLSSVGAQLLTGYGVQPRWILLVTLTLLLAPAGVYTALMQEMPVSRGLYYSIVTFVTSPPDPAPPGGVVRAIAGIQTFAGTAAIVFLGYVLANRQRV